MGKALAKPLEVEKILARPKFKDRIYRVGVELEGGWLKVPEGVELEHDGSVRGLVGPMDPERKVRKHLSVGELASTALEVSKIDNWIQQSYPHAVNHTCGLHVHMSFRNAWYYQLLMVPEYQATVVYQLHKWAETEKLAGDHPIWPRLRGESDFCQLEFWAQMQAACSKKDYSRNKPGHRYTAINYCAGQHDTVECRILPMMETAELAIKAVHRVLDITNACLLLRAMKEPKILAKIELQGQSLKREHQYETGRMREFNSDERFVREYEEIV